MTERAWHAPGGDGEVLCDPPPGGFAELLGSNRRLDACTARIDGVPLGELRRPARAEAIARAADYLRTCGEQLPPFEAGGPLLLAGHQPDLPHPGVWLKHFALHALARRHGLTPLNLVVDTDTIKSAALRVPLVDADPARVRAAAIPYDADPGGVPFEAHPVADEGLFASLPARVAPKTAGWGFRPMLDAFWAEAVARRERFPKLGERLAAARRAFERRWGCRNLEVPVSALCVGESFARLVRHILNDLPRFHAVYNGCLRDYRLRYRVRSRSHPVPDLGSEDGWLEAPFWASAGGERRRGRLMARPTAGGVEVSIRLPGKVVGSAGADRVHTRDMGRAGWRVRPRALTTTLFARLLLGDAFLHGVGGGLYDRLTDAIVRGYFGLEPPGYAVVSGTLRLPLAIFPATEGQRRALQRRRRDLEWNPQRFAAAGDPAVAALLRERESWLARTPAGREGRRRWRELRRVTEQLRKSVELSASELRPTLERCERELSANAILRDRGYAFCLHPEDGVRRFCCDFRA